MRPAITAALVAVLILAPTAAFANPPYAGVDATRTSIADAVAPLQAHRCDVWSARGIMYGAQLADALTASAASAHGGIGRTPTTGSTFATNVLTQAALDLAVGALVRRASLRNEEPDLRRHRRERAIERAPKREHEVTPRRLKLREAAALLALVLLAACGGGGGGTFSPFAPGVSGGGFSPAPVAIPTTSATPTPPPTTSATPTPPPATPAPGSSLAVLPATPTMANVGSTATVVATLSSGQALVPVTYSGGCANVATIAPTTQLTGVGGSTPPYTLTALEAGATCTARFTAGALQGTTSPIIGSAPATPSPSPTVAPTATPTAPPTTAPHVGPLTVTPATLGIGDGTASATFTASDPGDTGAFSESDTCAGIATITPSAASGPTATYTATYVAAGTCTVTISGAGGSGSVAITSTSVSFTTQSKGRTP